MPHITNSKNILYNQGTLHVGGNLHIGDNIYTPRELAHTILFLSFLPVEKEPQVYQLQLNFKCKHLSGNQLPGHQQGQPLIESGIRLEISSHLIRRLQEFQENRRRVGNLRYKDPQSNAQIIQEEIELQTLLYQSLMVGDIAVVVNDFVSLLQRQKIGDLVLAIHSSAAEVMDLPWEMLLPKFFPATSGPGHLGRANFSLVRTFEPKLEDFELQGDLSSGGPLRLLFVAALPEDLAENSKMLELEKEQEKLIQAIGFLESEARPPIVIEWLDHASLEQMDEALRLRQHDIVHISGHGAYLAGQQGGVLYMEDEYGDERKVTGAELGALLQKHPSVKLLMLSACETALTGQDGFVKTLSDFGLPAVVGMRFPITDPGAMIFTSAFYTQLSKGYSLANATYFAREALWQMVQQQRQDQPEQPSIAEWFTPLVFVNQFIGRLTDHGKSYQKAEDFYSKSPLVKGFHSRTIGGGFIGRKRYLIQLRQAFRAGRQVCLYGLGGLGKTTLAEAFADNYRHAHGKYEVLVFRGTQEINEKVMIDRLGKRYYLQFQALGQTDNAEEWQAFLESDQEPEKKLGVLLQNYLAAHRIILLLDNFEDVQQVPHQEANAQDNTDAAPRKINSASLARFLQLLVQYLPASCHLLFTTRYPIVELQERIQHLQLNKMGFAESYRFFNYSDSLRRVAPADRSAIFKRLDGHPRAFEYLMALLHQDEQLQWADLEAKLGQVESDIFENLLLAELYQRLTPAQREVLGYAAIFLYPTDPAALAAVSTQEEAVLIPVLSELQQWSLCQLDAAGHFEVHRLTAAWLFREPFSQEEYKVWSLRAAEYFDGLKRGKEGGKYIEDGLLARVYFWEAETWDEVARVSFNLETYYKKSGYYFKALEVMEGLIDLPLKPDYKAETRFRLGKLYQHFGKMEWALEYYEQAGEIWQGIGDTISAAAALGQIGRIHQDRGNYEEALAKYQEVLIIFQEADDQENISTALHQIGRVHEEKGEYDRALQYYQQSQKIKEDIGDSAGLAGSLHQIGIIHQKKGEHDQALQYYQQSLKIEEEIGNIAGVAISIHQIGRIHEEKGDFAQALECYQQSLKIKENIGNISGVAISIHQIGRIHEEKGDFAQALECYQQSLKIKENIGNISGVAHSLGQIGLLHFQQEQFSEALYLLVQAYLIFEKLSSPNIEIVGNCIQQLRKKLGEDAFTTMLKEVEKRL